MSTDFLSEAVQCSKKREYKKRSLGQRAAAHEAAAASLRERERKERVTYLIEIGAALVASLKSAGDSEYAAGCIENLLLDENLAGKQKERRTAALDWLRAEISI